MLYDASNATIAAALTPIGEKPAEWDWRADLLDARAQRIASLPNFHFLPAWEGSGHPRCPATGKEWTLTGEWQTTVEGLALDLTGAALATIPGPALPASTPFSAWFFLEYLGDSSTFSRPFEQDFMGIFRRSSETNPPWVFLRSAGSTIGDGAIENDIQVGDILTFGVTSYGNGKYAGTYRDGVVTASTASLTCTDVSAGTFAFGGEPDDSSDAVSMVLKAGFFCHGTMDDGDFAYLNNDPFALLRPDVAKVLPTYPVASSGGTTITAGVAAITLTAQSATVYDNTNIAAGVAAITMTAYAATAIKNTNILADVASITMSAKSATVSGIASAGSALKQYGLTLAMRLGL